MLYQWIQVIILTLFISLNIGCVDTSLEGKDIDDIQPSVIEVSPEDGEEGVALDTQIIVTFSEPIDPQTINSYTIFIDDDTDDEEINTSSVVTLDDDGIRATLTLDDLLDELTTYTVIVTTLVKDLARNPLNQNPGDVPVPFTSAFTTVSYDTEESDNTDESVTDNTQDESIPDDTSDESVIDDTSDESISDNTTLTVISTVPEDGAVDVSTDAVITVVFSKPIDTSTLYLPADGSTGTLWVEVDGGVVEGELTFLDSDTKTEFNPSEAFIEKSLYMVIITNGIKDPKGNPLDTGSEDGEYTITFTSGKTPYTASPGDVVINEFMADPNAVSDADGEYFELFNTTEMDIKLDSWTISDDSTSFTVQSTNGGAILFAHEYFVFCKNIDQAENGVIDCDYQFSRWSLTNTDDEIILQDSRGNVIDEVRYGGDGWSTIKAGKSLELNDPSLDNNDGSNWSYAENTYGDGDCGSPGEGN